MVKTMTLRLEMPTDRTLRIPLPPDVPDGSLEVVLVIALAEPSVSATHLAGRWEPYFPAEFDVGNVLRELRHEWEEEWTADDE